MQTKARATQKVNSKLRKDSNTDKRIASGIASGGKAESMTSAKKIKKK